MHAAATCITSVSRPDSTLKVRSAITQVAQGINKCQMHLLHSLVTQVVPAVAAAATEPVAALNSISERTSDEQSEVWQDASGSSEEGQLPEYMQIFEPSEQQCLGPNMPVPRSNAATSFRSLSCDFSGTWSRNNGNGKTLFEEGRLLNRSPGRSSPCPCEHLRTDSFTTEWR